MRPRSGPRPAAIGAALRRLTASLAAGTAALCFVASSAALASASAPAWQLTLLPTPTDFAASTPQCESEVSACNRYVLLAQNVGGRATAGTVTLREVLPKGLIHVQVRAEEGNGLECPAPKSLEVTCTTSRPVATGETLAMRVFVSVAAGTTGTLAAVASVEGGEAPGPVMADANTTIGARPPFSVASFQSLVADAGGLGDGQAADHPYAATASLYFPTIMNGGEPQPREGLRDLIVKLPPGFLGNTQALPQCPESALPPFHGVTSCPADTQVGTVTVAVTNGHDVETNSSRGFPLYNMVPPGGYPAAFGFLYTGLRQEIIYATLNRIRGGGAGGYRLEIAVPAVAKALNLWGVSVDLWGEPADPSHDPTRKVPGQKLGGAPQVAFLTTPADCSGGALPFEVEASRWSEPANFTPPATSYGLAPMEGCSALAFQSSLRATFETSHADQPAGLSLELGVPQRGHAAGELATPPVRDITIALPAGVSLSPSAAEGLEGCPATGPDGFNLEAEEVGEGHLGGNGSPYDDGLSHVEPGHCPAASTIGAVTLEGPAFAGALQGHLYLAAPTCGGPSEAPCTEADASEGRLYRVFLEVAGSGAIVKLAGSVRAEATSGDLRFVFEDGPQVPFGAVTIRLKGGARAPLATPQACGASQTTAEMTPWSSPFTPQQPTEPSSFTTTGPCGRPFAPGFLAGVTNATAGAPSPFTFSLARSDGEQDLSSLAVQLPPGLDGNISAVPPCPEPQASQGSCPAPSRIGTAVVAVGAGAQPLYRSGAAYLTGPYRGSPYGLSITVPARGGPYDLGNVVVRGGVDVNPNSAALSATIDPLPQAIDGVPLRTKLLDLTIDRPGFLVNPTSCAPMLVGGTAVSSLGTSASLASPFQVKGCRSLPFAPKLTAAVAARGSKANGTTFSVKLQTRGLGQANVRRLDLTIPAQLPARAQTLKRACRDTVFDANPASCDQASVIGEGIVRTPLYEHPLRGPAYLVQHAGAEFPAVVFVLQGQGVTIAVDGTTAIRKGALVARFETPADAPFTSFEATLPAGPNSILTPGLADKARHSLCATKLTAPSEIAAQNGAVLHQITRVAVLGCGKARSASAKRARRR
jgi:hypothetical protein